MKVGCLTEFECAVYADGELPSKEAREINDHLEICAACRQAVGILRAESRVLVECFQSTDFLEFELEDESLSVPRSEKLNVARFAAFVLAMSVLLRPLAFLDELELPFSLSWLAMTASYVVPAGFNLIDSILKNANWIALGAILFLMIVVLSRRPALTNSILSVLALLTVFSSSSYAFDVRRSDKPLAVPADETIDDTLVVTAESATIDGTVNGDLIALGRQVTIRGTVKGNVFSLAQRVEVEGTVEGNVIGAAQSVQVRGHVGRNVYGFGQTVGIARGTTIDQNAMVFGAESDIDGTIGKDVIAGAGSINVGAPAKIGGTFTARVGRNQDVRIAPGATITGATNIQTTPPAPSRYSTASFYVWQTIWLTGALLTGLVLFWLVPGLSRATFDGTAELLASVGIGFLTLVATPIAAVVAGITLIGLPLGMILFVCWLLACYLAKIVVAGFVGRSLLSGSNAQPIALILLVGLALIVIAINIPFVGPLINLFLIMIGLGVIVMKTYRSPRFHPAHAA
jgi:Putative zinc-finger